ncbi:MAG: dihydroneopterin aldolase [Muribaculaceae bacterium]|nr:dihydroneopterin aldolase [Muribaculaceae bacterium]
MSSLTISLKGLRFYSFIGYFEQERIIGNDFSVDLEVSFPRNTPVTDDSLEEMVSYADLYDIVKYEMNKGGKLLETVAWRISEKIKKKKRIITSGIITISKLHPPMTGIDGYASVSLHF